MNAARFANVLNAALWFANGIVWTFYSGVVLMGVASLAAMALSIFLARME